MRQDNDAFDWDQLLNGEPHTVDLTDYQGGINDFRARAYREADRRKRVVKTNKVDVVTVRVQATYGAGLHGCTCNAPPGRRHMPICAVVLAEADKEERRQALEAAVAASSAWDEAQGGADPGSQL